MTPKLPLCLLAVAACAVDEPTTAITLQDATVTATRERLSGDLAHYVFDVPVGTTPNARLRIHRVVRELAPWVPRPTARAVMMLHGDFATYTTNFLAPGMAAFLAARDIDAWGLDRRWTLPGPTDDVSDFADMSVAQELDDLGRALALARAASGKRLALVGFSHGGQLAYLYAAADGRNVDALVPIDIYEDIAPADADLRATACDNAAFERDFLAQGFIDADNSFIIALGELARTAPDEVRPDGLTNLAAMLRTVGQTYLFAPFAPFYHLNAPVLDGDAVAGLAESPEAAVEAWLASAPPHQSMREAADLDGMWCGEAPLPVAAPLANIRVPVLFLGAAGGIGVNGLYSLQQTRSRDASSLIVGRLPPERRAEDTGHADLLLGTDAPARAWQPLAAWLLHH